jgi:hypothetical protein
MSDDPNRRVRLVDFETVAADMDAKEPTSEPRPGHTWRSRSLLALAADPPAPPTIGGLLYPAKRTLLSGETESLKTWLTLILAKAEMDAGLPVVWVDLDAMGGSELLARLRALGVADPVIDELFLYKEPSERIVGAALDEVCAETSERGARLFVIDSFNPMLWLHGLDPTKTPDIEAFWRQVADPITRAGAAPVLIDHVPKSADNRGKYAYGSERKATGAIVHVGAKLVSPLARCGTGSTVLLTQKDRQGFLPRPTIGKLVLDAEGDTITYRLEDDHSRSVTGRFRPTVLMERVSRVLEAEVEAQSQTWIEAHVKGKTEGKRRAIEVLVAEGFLARHDIARGGSAYESARVYREADDEGELDSAPSPPPAGLSSDPAFPPLPFGEGGVRDSPPRTSPRARPRQPRLPAVVVRAVRARRDRRGRMASGRA